MILYVYDRNFSIVGVIDAYESLIWTNRYYIEGDFELYVPANQKNLEILQNIICLEIDFSVFTTTKNHDFQTRCSKKSYPHYLVVFSFSHIHPLTCAR